MKAIKTGRFIHVSETWFDGGNGWIRLPRNNKHGFIKASVVWSWGGGWEHVSIAPLNGSVPSWDDMCFVKDLFFDPEDWVVQFHPARSEYVNNMPNCLHLWKPIDEKLPTPPSIFAGIKGVDCSWR